MELLIVRHAIACERNRQRWPDDADRPLSSRGVARARRAAAGLRRIAPRPLQVLASPLERTRHTAALLTEFAGWPDAQPCPQLRPGAATQALLSLLAQRTAACVAVVGHEPDLSHLLVACLPGKISGNAFALRKMGAALVVFPASVRSGGGELQWLLAPRLLRLARHG
jgi:phosphohistidine phosphatase